MSVRRARAALRLLCAEMTMTVSADRSLLLEDIMYQAKGHTEHAPPYPRTYLPIFSDENYRTGSMGAQA